MTYHRGVSSNKLPGSNFKDSFEVATSFAIVAVTFVAIVRDDGKSIPKDISKSLEGGLTYIF